MTQYNQMKDEQIIRQIKEGDQEALDFLMNKYKNVVRKKAKALFLIGGEKEDLIQEGMIGLYKAVRDYQEAKHNSFYTFADLCVSRQMYSAIKASQRKKNLPLNTYVSLYAPITGDSNKESDENPALVDTMLHDRVQNPESLIIDKENTSLIEDKLLSRLSPLEKQVLELYMSDMKYVTIAKVLQKEPKSIDNALQRIKMKLTQVLKEVS